jgi:hypothetical protein
MKFRWIYLGFFVVLLSGCAVSRPYSEGVLATSDTLMSIGELRIYETKIGQEIERVNRGGTAPEGVTREMYLEDLRSRQEAVRTRMMMAEHLKQKDEFEDRYPSP